MANSWAGLRCRGRHLVGVPACRIPRTVGLAGGTVEGWHARAACPKGHAYKRVRCHRPTLSGSHRGNPAWAANGADPRQIRRCPSLNMSGFPCPRVGPLLSRYPRITCALLPRNAGQSNPERPRANPPGWTAPFGSCAPASCCQVLAITPFQGREATAQVERTWRFAAGQARNNTDSAHGTCR